MQEQIITHKHNKTIFVTELRQFALPAAIHVDTIRKAVQRQFGAMILDLCGFRESVVVWDYATERDAREDIVSKMVDRLKKYGVYVGAGTHFEVKE